jgi:tetratricopeptide (TPR) repeat protein
VGGHVFISHASRDKGIVADLGKALGASGVDVWIDHRELEPGGALDPEIERALAEARAVVAVLGPHTINSTWVMKEIARALDLQKQRGSEYRVIPVMLPGLEPAGLRVWFGEEPVGLKISLQPGGVQRVLPDLLDGLGLSRPAGAAPPAAVAAAPVAELTLELRDPEVDRTGGTHRGAAIAELVYHPAQAGAREVRSPRFRLVAPLGPIEFGELRWYLERYASWPSSPFQARAREVEKLLPEWGRRLHAAALEPDAARKAYEAWKHSGERVSRRFTVWVDRNLVAGGGADGDEQARRQADADEAATLLLGLPWELLHDGNGYLSSAASPVGVRRALPNLSAQPALVTNPPLRVLLVSPRPEDESATYIDHRVSARPVVEAVAALGDLAELTLLAPPTFAALTGELDEARRQERPYHIVHFDGHGVYSRRTGLGALCFENPDDGGKLEARRSEIVDAAALASAMRDRRVPLFFLEACQTAVAEKDPTASVAGTLLSGGVASVVAMSHAVLVETARRFVSAFYRQLITGRRVGEAVLAGQRELEAHRFRHRTFVGDLHLADWFVPVLFQEEDDPQLIQEVPARRVLEELNKQREKSLGDVPPEPDHGFVGRSSDLLAAERLLERERYVVLRGEGGEGKTTLAAELARWLVDTRRFERAAFASLEEHGDARALLHALGHQLVSEFESRAGQGEDRAWQEVERALRERRTLIVLDNLESVLAPEPGAPAGAFEPEVAAEVLGLARKLAAIRETRLVLTTRQPVPPPLAGNEVRIGRLARPEAIALVADVLGQEHGAPRHDDPGESEDEVAGLVDAVGCHARSLVLVAREVGGAGVRGATERLAEIMARLQARHPDDRERSLYASVELSLRRLPTGTREMLRPLAVFSGGGHLWVMAQVLELDLEKPEQIRAIAESLVSVGLAEELPYGYLRLDPALGPLLRGELAEEEQAAARERWTLAMSRFTEYLYGAQFGDDPAIATTLTVLDLPNLLGALERLGNLAAADLVVGVATKVETLLHNLGRPRALGRASRVRETAAAKLGEWGHARCLAEGAAAERLLEAGRLREAAVAAQGVLSRARAAGEQAYAGAPYDLAVALLRLGRILKEGGDAASALAPLREARDRLQGLADTEGGAAPRMASVAITEIGDCLRDLGRLDDAALSYETAIKLDEERGEPRDVAVGKGQLGTVRRRQRRFDEALKAWEDARETFEQLGDLRNLGVAWHNIGLIHMNARNTDAAERAYQKALGIVVQVGDRHGEGGTLAELGNLYDWIGRREEAVNFHREAATLAGDLNDFASESRRRTNLGATLVALGRHTEARVEILRAIERMQPFGHTVAPWATFAILADIERAAGNGAAAEAARRRAFESYLTYRRDGGERSPGGSGPLFRLVEEAIVEGGVPAAEESLAALAAQADLPAYLGPLLPKLRAILRGSRDPALAADPNIDFDDAAELTLLLESLGGGAPA